jgi:DNA polymerase-3 subunit alpha
MLLPALHLRSQFSLLRAAWSIREMVAALVARGYTAAALTDRGSIAGAVEFWKAARAAGLHPIVGCELVVTHANQEGGLLVWVENDTGYRSLCRLLTRHSSLKAFRPADLNGHLDGLILATSGKEGLLHRLLESGRQREADRWLDSMIEIAGPDHFRIQLFHQHPGDTVRMSRLAEIAGRLAVPALAASEARCARPEDGPLLSALTSIGTLTLLDQAHPEKPDRPEGYALREPDHLVRDIFAPWPDAVEEAIRVAGRCHLPIFEERLAE